VVTRLINYCYLFLFVLAFLASCAREKPAELFHVSGSELPRRVAIMPFSNHSQSEQAGPIVRKMFYNFFSSLNYVDVEPSEVDDILRQAGIYDDIVKGRAVDIQQACQVLGADALIFGDVTTFGKIYAVLYSEVRAGMKARMLACPSGNPVWSYEHTSHIGEGGISISPLGLASTAAKVLLNLRQTIGMRVVSDLCMQMTSTIPNPPGITRTGPRIKVLVHNGANRLLVPGDRLKVVMVGEPGMSASWAISPGREGLRMEEKEPGVYVGVYQVQQGDRIMSGQVIGYLQGRDGGMSRWLDVLGPVTMAMPTVLPVRVKGQLVLDRHGSPYVIQDTLVVGSGDRLVIDPGVQVWVKGLGIVVMGSLSVTGSQAEPVRIKGQADSIWKGIIMDSPQGVAKLRYLAVSGAERGIAAKDAVILLDHCILSGNTWGIVIDESNATITASVISQSAKTGISLRNAKAVITGSAMVENASGGVLVKASEVEIHQSDIFNNGKWNLKVMDSDSRVDARQNWWGISGPGLNGLGIEGPVKVQPVLKASSRSAFKTSK